MSGFFVVRKSVLNIDVLQPKGFKILLEILMRTPDLHVAEVPFKFGARHAGESKANLREGIRYLSQIFQLYVGEDALSFYAPYSGWPVRFTDSFVCSVCDHRWAWHSPSTLGDFGHPDLFLVEL